MTPAQFIAAIGPAAQLNATSKSGVPASFTIAQAALESAWGESILTQRANNLFGIKAGRAWDGATVDMHTQEVLNGQRVTVVARWRAYHNWQESIDDHGRFLQQNPRYGKCFLPPVPDGEEFARLVAAAGYSTDPQYAEKVISVIRAHNLKEYDK